MSSPCAGSPCGGAGSGDSVSWDIKRILDALLAANMPHLVTLKASNITYFLELSKILLDKMESGFGDVVDGVFTYTPNQDSDDSDDSGLYLPNERLKIETNKELIVCFNTYSINEITFYTIVVVKSNYDVVIYECIVDDDPEPSLLDVLEIYDPLSYIARDDEKRNATCGCYTILTCDDECKARCHNVPILSFSKTDIILALKVADRITLPKCALMEVMSLVGNYKTHTLFIQHLYK